MGTTFSDRPHKPKLITTFPTVDHESAWLDVTSPSCDSHRILPLTLCVIGDSNVGKSTIIKQYVQHIFDTRHVPTTAIHTTTYWLKKFNLDLCFHEIPASDLIHLDELHARLQWMALRGISGFIAVYDVTKHASYTNITQKLNAFLKMWYGKHGIHIPTLILGNKMVSFSSKETGTTCAVSRSEVLTWCQHNRYNQRFDLDQRILKGYKLAIGGYLRRCEWMLNMTKEALLSGKRKTIPRKVHALCFEYMFDHGKYTMIEDQISAANHYQVRDCIEQRFLDIVIARYDETALDEDYT